MKTKKELLAALNNLVITDIYNICPDVQKVWEDIDYQKKLASALGLRNKDIANIPKRNKSSYLFFCQELRSSIVSENPGIKPNQVMVLLGKKWSELSDDQKKVYNEQAEEDKSRYISIKENSKRTKSGKISSYLRFCADERPNLKKQYPDLTTKEITTKLGSLWNDYKKNKTDYLKTKYDFSETDDNICPKPKIVPSIPVSINSRHTKAIQELIKNNN